MCVSNAERDRIVGEYLKWSWVIFSNDSNAVAERQRAYEADTKRRQDRGLFTADEVHIGVLAIAKQTRSAVAEAEESTLAAVPSKEVEDFARSRTPEDIERARMLAEHILSKAELLEEQLDRLKFDHMY